MTNEDPYAEVDWDHWGTLDSMSHQHQGRTRLSRSLPENGLRAFRLQQLLSSAPTYPLPDPWLARNSGIIAAPNAETAFLSRRGPACEFARQSPRHRIRGQRARSEMKISPLLHRFEGLTPFSGPRPWRRLPPRPETGVEGSEDHRDPLDRRTTECVLLREGFAEKGGIRGRTIAAGSHTFHLISVGEGDRCQGGLRSRDPDHHPIPPHAGIEPALARGLPGRARRGNRRWHQSRGIALHPMVEASP